MNVRGLHSNAKKRIDIFEWAKGKNIYQYDQITISCSNIKIHKTDTISR